MLLIVIYICTWRASLPHSQQQRNTGEHETVWIFREEVDPKLGFVPGKSMWSRDTGWERDGEDQDLTAVSALWLVKDHFLLSSFSFLSHLCPPHPLPPTAPGTGWCIHDLLQWLWSAQWGSHFQMDLTGTSITSTAVCNYVINSHKTLAWVAGVATSTATWTPNWLPQRMKWEFVWFTCWPSHRGLTETSTCYYRF